MSIRASLFKLLALSLLTTLGAGTVAFAQETPGVVDAYNAQRLIRTQFAQGDTATSSQAALNILVDQGLQVLAANGEATLADQLRGEWNSQFTTYLTDFAANATLGLTDLGDHDPLSPWLANFQATLKAKTRGAIEGIRIINDVFTMNYALGVVLHPKSKTWKSGEAQADEWEYRKHFIPMANIITYWVTLEACNYAVKKIGAPQAKQVCGIAATKLEFYMGRYWAPKLSDSVYRKANGAPSARGSVWPSSRQNVAPDFVLTEAQFEAEVLAAVN